MRSSILCRGVRHASYFADAIPSLTKPIRNELQFIVFLEQLAPNGDPTCLATYCLSDAKWHSFPTTEFIRATTSVFTGDDDNKAALESTFKALKLRSEDYTCRANQTTKHRKIRHDLSLHKQMLAIPLKVESLAF